MTTQVAPNPQRILQFAFGFIPTLAVSSAVELGIFGLIHEGKNDLHQLCQASQCEPRGLAPLLHTLVSLDLLKQDGDRYSLSPESEMFLVPQSRAFLGGMLTHLTATITHWGSFTETVRKGRGPVAVEGDEDNGAFFASFVDSLFNLNFPAAQAVAAQLGPAQSVLDVGCGSAVWSLALTALHPELRVTAVDRPVVLEKVTTAFAQRMGCLDRFTMVPGNFRDLDFGQHDLVILGHILHSEGLAASRTLLKRCKAALKPGGKLVVAEMVAGEPRGSDVFSNLFDLNMLMHTEDGTVFTRAQLEEMGREAGFAHFEWLNAPSPYPILVAS